MEAEVARRGWLAGNEISAAATAIYKRSPIIVVLLN